MMKIDDEGGKGGREMPKFGWHNMWTAPYDHDDPAGEDWIDILILIMKMTNTVRLFDCYQGKKTDKTLKLVMTIMVIMTTMMIEWTCDMSQGRIRGRESVMIPEMRK